MNTPAHLIVGLGAMGRPGRPALIAAALIGAMIPDLSLYILVFWEGLIKGTAPQVIFDQLYFSDFWMSVFAIDNSLVLWGLGLGAALILRVPWAVALCGAALLHIITDFPLHMEDARPHLWPLTSWRFQSPVSYWNVDHGAAWIGTLELLLCVALVIYIWRRFRSWQVRALAGLLLALECASTPVWWLVF